jgi:hypothetical protein
MLLIYRIQILLGIGNKKNLVITFKLLKQNQSIGFPFGIYDLNCGWNI